MPSCRHWRRAFNRQSDNRACNYVCVNSARRQPCGVVFLRRRTIGEYGCALRIDLARDDRYNGATQTLSATIRRTVTHLNITALRSDRLHLRRC